MVITDFYQKTVFLDTAPLIYFIEGHSEYQEKLMTCFLANDDDEFTFITSSITLLEVLVKPLRERRPKLVAQYREIFLNASGILLVEVSNDIAEGAAKLRAKYNLKTPDAIQVATALEHQADYFFTNDYRLAVIQEITIVTLADL